MKKEIILLVALTAILILLTHHVGHLHSAVRYVDTPCPACQSSEVLDYGTDTHGNQRAHCYDCSLNFTVINKLP